MRIQHLLLTVIASASCLVSALRAGILEDRAIEDAMEASYVFQHVLTDRSMVQVYIRQGAAELRGQAADERERALLGYTVGAIKNVTTVQNLLFVDSADKRANGRWRALRVRAQLLTRGDVDLRRTRVNYAADHWQIAGTVADEAERARVLQGIATIASPEPVRVSLEFAPSGAPTAIDDPSIAAMVRCALEALPAMPAPLEITSEAGAVVIRGSVRSPAGFDDISRVAAGIRGVKSVENRMTISGE